MRPIRIVNRWNLQYPMCRSTHTSLAHPFGILATTLRSTDFRSLAFALPRKMRQTRQRCPKRSESMRRLPNILSGSLFRGLKNIGERRASGAARVGSYPRSQYVRSPKSQTIFLRLPKMTRTRNTRLRSRIEISCKSIQRFFICNFARAKILSSSKAFRVM